MKNTCAIDIEAPITKVFDFINDENKHKLWLEGLEETIREPGYNSKKPVGSKFQQKLREGKKVEVYDGEVTAYNRPHHLARGFITKGCRFRSIISSRRSRNIHILNLSPRSHSRILRSRCSPGRSPVRSCAPLSKSR